MDSRGLIVLKSAHGPKETMDRVEAAVRARAIGVAARVDHAGAAATVGLALRPTEVLIFGNPKAGTPLMQRTQTIAIDLPLKILVWQDADGFTWLAYNDMHWLAERHGTTADDGALRTIAEGIAAIAKEATVPV